MVGDMFKHGALYIDVSMIATMAGDDGLAPDVSSQRRLEFQVLIPIFAYMPPSMANALNSGTLSYK
jgi:hypothetical protein